MFFYKKKLNVVVVHFAVSITRPAVGYMSLRCSAPVEQHCDTKFHVGGYILNNLDYTVISILELGR